MQHFSLPLICQLQPSWLDHAVWLPNCMSFYVFTPRPDKPLRMPDVMIITIDCTQSFHGGNVEWSATGLSREFVEECTLRSGIIQTAPYYALSFISQFICQSCSESLLPERNLFPFLSLSWETRSGCVKSWQPSYRKIKIQKKKTLSHQHIWFDHLIT